MKSFHSAESTQPASSHYAPSVPMSVYRELATELRANKAVIDSLNSRNQQLIEQNQRLKQEIHNVVQATLNLGQFAGVARQAQPNGFSQEFPSAIAPDTLSRLVRAQQEIHSEVQQPTQDATPHNQPKVENPQEAPDLIREIAQAAAMQASARRPHPPIATPPQPSTPPKARSPRPIPTEKAADRPAHKASGQKRARAKNPERETMREAMPKRKSASKKTTQKAKTSKLVSPVSPARQPKGKKSDALAIPSAQAMSKLFTEQSGEYRSSIMESGDEKEIGGIWLALSIILIIVTAFGAGFLIMKPLLNDR